jgi:hypothetical protein
VVFLSIMNITDIKIKQALVLIIDPSLFIHPIIAVPDTSLVIAAFVLKARRRKYYRAHYVVAMAGFIPTAVAIPIGLKAVLLSYARFIIWPPNFNSTPWNGHDLCDTNFGPSKSRNYHAYMENLVRTLTGFTESISNLESSWRPLL